MNPSGTQLLDAVRALAPSLTAQAADIEEGRRLPSPLLAALREAGLFRMFVPRALGGLAVDLRTGLTALELLAQADGAVGWTVMIGSETPQLFALLPHESVRTLYAEGGPDLILGGGFNAQGQARAVPGGYQVTGRWAFASGSEHCDWLFGNCVVLSEDGRPRGLSAAGMPELRAMVFRA